MTTWLISSCSTSQSITVITCSVKISTKFASLKVDGKIPCRTNISAGRAFKSKEVPKHGVHSKIDRHQRSHMPHTSFNVFVTDCVIGANVAAQGKQYLICTRTVRQTVALLPRVPPRTSKASTGGSKVERAPHWRCLKRSECTHTTRFEIFRHTRVPTMTIRPHCGGPRT